MKNLRDPRTKIVPSKTRGGKEVSSSSALDSPSILNRLATPPPHAIKLDMSQVIDDDTSAINDASTLLDDNAPLGEFIDEQLARAKEIELPKWIILRKLMKSLQLKILKYLLATNILELKCLKYLKIML